MIVIKIGGGKEINYDFVLKDFLNHQDAILVHGGNYEMKVVSEKLNVPVKMITSASGISSRRTDRETMNIFQMVYCGKMNKMIVEKLQQNGVNAIGLSGMDGRIVEGKRKDAIIIVEEGKRKVLRDDLSGKPEKVNTDLLKMLLKNKYVPVLCPPAISHDNMPINVDGDRFASIIASEMKADALIILSNVPGLLKNPDDESTLIKQIKKSEVSQFLGYAKERMKRKLMGAIEALEAGVRKVVFADARIENPIGNALNGNGTVIE